MAEGFCSLALSFFNDKVREVGGDFSKSIDNQQTKPGKINLAGAVHEAVMPDLHEPQGQDMLEKTSDKLKGIDGERSLPSGTGFAVGKCNLPAVDGNDAGIGDGNPKDIRSQVFERCFGVPYSLAVDIPCCLPDIGIYLGQHCVFHHLGLEFCFEDFGKRPNREIKAVLGGEPFFPVL